MSVFAEERRQMGGSLFATIKRFAIPLLQKLWPHLKTLGKKALGSALNVGSGLASDLISGQAKNIPSNFRRRSKQEVNSLSRDYLGQDVFTHPDEQSGSGRKRKAINMFKKPAKRLAKNKSKNKRRRKLAIETDIFS